MCSTITDKEADRSADGRFAAEPPFGDDVPADTPAARVALKVPRPDSLVEVRLTPPDSRFEVKVSPDGETIELLIHPGASLISLRLSPPAPEAAAIPAPQSDAAPDDDSADEVAPGMSRAEYLALLEEEEGAEARKLLSDLGDDRFSGTAPAPRAFALPEDIRCLLEERPEAPAPDEVELMGDFPSPELFEALEAESFGAGSGAEPPETEPEEPEEAEPELEADPRDAESLGPVPEELEAEAEVLEGGPEEPEPNPEVLEGGPEEPEPEVLEGGPEEPEPEVLEAIPDEDGPTPAESEEAWKSPRLVSARPAIPDEPAAEPADLPEVNDAVPSSFETLSAYDPDFDEEPPDGLGTPLSAVGAALAASPALPEESPHEASDEPSAPEPDEPIAEVEADESVAASPEPEEPTAFPEEPVEQPAAGSAGEPALVSAPEPVSVPEPFRLEVIPPEALEEVPESEIFTVAGPEEVPEPEDEPAAPEAVEEPKIPEWEDIFPPIEDIIRATASAGPPNFPPEDFAEIPGDPAEPPAEAVDDDGTDGLPPDDAEPAPQWPSGAVNIGRGVQGALARLSASVQDEPLVLELAEVGRRPDEDPPASPDPPTEPAPAADHHRKTED